MYRTIAVVHSGLLGYFDSTDDTGSHGQEVIREAVFAHDGRSRRGFASAQSGMQNLVTQ